MAENNPVYPAHVPGCSANFANVYKVAERDVVVLMEKGKTYGDSWKQRGGVGAFMMLARKWDRIENQVRACGYDVFTAVLADPATRDGLLDDIQDLRRYLLLVEEEVTAQSDAANPRGRGYAEQG